jgi:hypothetical protein
LEEFRVGFVLDHDRAPVSNEVGVNLAKAIEARVGAGATVSEECRIGDYLPGHDAFMSPPAAASGDRWQARAQIGGMRSVRRG